LEKPGGSSEEDEAEKERAKEKAKGRGKGPRRFSETEDEFKPEESEEEAAEGEYENFYKVARASLADPGHFFPGSGSKISILNLILDSD